MANLTPLIGAIENPVQIDESYFRGRRMYHRGRFLSGNRKVLVSGSDTDYTGDTIDEDVRPGPWVFGIYCFLANQL